MSQATAVRNKVILKKLIKSIKLDGLFQTGVGGVTQFYAEDRTFDVRPGNLAWGTNAPLFPQDSKHGILIIGKVNKKIIEKNNKLKFIFEMSVILNDLLRRAAGEIHSLEGREITFSRPGSDEILRITDDGNYEIRLHIAAKPGSRRPAYAGRALLGINPAPTGYAQPVDYMES